MEDEKKIISENISKNIQQSSPKPIITKEIAEKEEEISKTVAKLPVIKDELEERKKKVIHFIKKEKEKLTYLILAFIVFISVYIRSRNISKLKDITTGTWTLGPDLDPFLFLRWAEYIVEHGKLMVIDMMRNVPLGFNTAGDMKFLSYLIAWLYHFLSFFSQKVTVTYAAIIFPVVMAALTAIAFFLFTRKIFYKEKKDIKNLIALISTIIFVLVPSLLPRTIAGIPEKESAAFFFMFLAFYFFLQAFTSEKFKKRLIWGFLAGSATAGMALIWGGVIFVFFTIPTAFLISFILGKIKKQEFLIYFVWLLTSFILMMPFSTRYALKNLIISTSTGFAIGILIIIGGSLLIIKKDFLKTIRKKIKISKELFSFGISLIILIILLLIFLGPSFTIGQIQGVKNSLIVPTHDRFSMTVAENRQPYFANDWKNSFGPIKLKIPLFFWLFFIGSIVLFHKLVKTLNKKQRIILTFGYTVFLFCLIFSRHSSSSILNGTSIQSLLVYFGGVIFFLGSFWRIYNSKYKQGNLYDFKKFEFSYILYFIILTLGIIGARGGIRLIMVLGAVSPVAIGFLVVKVSQKYFKEKEDFKKLFIGIFALLIILDTFSTVWTYYKTDKATASNFAPGVYQWQWQKAMKWVRENTMENAVFAHWWDYGYWLQSIGNRATILDGGNAISYWNYLMGRYVLTGTNEEKAIEFLYSHNGTHLLIDSTELGKYTAYSSIGSDENYDRFSWINTFVMDESQTQELKNITYYFYPGGVGVDEDIIWEQEDKKILFPKKVAAVGGIIIGKRENKLSQPEAVFIYNGDQYKIPLRFMFYKDQLYDFESGLDAGVFIYPKMNVVSDQVSINDMGALFYLSKRTINSNLANLYLFNKKSDYFKLVHTEDNLIIQNLRDQGLDIGDFLQYQGFQGPIKIWEINYPKNLEINPDFLNKEYPLNIKMAKPGEYI